MVSDHRAQIEERLAAVTPGEWKPTRFQAAVVSHTGDQQFSIADCSNRPRSKQNSVFIAAAPDDVRWLLDELERKDKALPDLYARLLEKRQLLRDSAADRGLSLKERERIGAKADGVDLAASFVADMLREFAAGVPPESGGAMNRSAQWLASMRYRYLTDADFHAAVEVIYQEKMDAEFAKRHHATLARLELLESEALADNLYDELGDENERLRAALRVLQDDAADLCVAAATMVTPEAISVSREDADALDSARVRTERACANAAAALDQEVGP